MRLSLPQPIEAYFAAANSGELDRFDDCFAGDAEVHDERATHRGVPAIKAWFAEALRRYRQRTEPTKIASGPEGAIVTAAVTGDFPGSPIALDHVFRLNGERIRSLTIRPAA